MPLSSVFLNQSQMTTVTNADSIFPDSNAQQNLWEVTNSGETSSSLIVPQLLLATEPKIPTTTTTTITTPKPTTISENIIHSKNNSNLSNDNENITTSFKNTSEVQLRPKVQPQRAVPKSPPRWPLRPGVMLHVSSDTKENIAVNRTTLKKDNNNEPCQLADNAEHMLGFSPLLPPRTDKNRHNVDVVNSAPKMSSTLPLCRKKPCQTYEVENETASNTINNVDAVTTEQTSKQSAPTKRAQIGNNFERRVEQILDNFVKRAKAVAVKNDTTRDSQRSHVGLLGSMFSRLQNPEHESQFATKHRLKGIRSSGSGN